MSSRETDGLETDQQEILLPPGRRSLVRLGVRALTEGQLNIMGVVWTLNDVARGAHQLELHGRRLNNTKTERIGKAYAFDQSLAMSVVAAMPLLEARIENFPQTMLLGEVAKGVLVLSNVGRTPLCELRLRLSQPAFCVLLDGSETACGDADALTDNSTKTILTKRPRLVAEVAETVNVAAHNGPANCSLFTLPLQNGELKPGESLDLSLWVRAAALGAHTLHFVFAYVPSVESSTLRRRLCPISTKLRVLPSLILRHTTRPLARPRGRSASPMRRGEGPVVQGLSSTDIALTSEYIFALQVKNASLDKGLLVSQISCLSSTWQGTMLHGVFDPDELLLPAEGRALYICLRALDPQFGLSSTEIIASPLTHCELVWGSATAHPIVDSRVAPHLESLLRAGAAPIKEACACDAAAEGIFSSRRHSPSAGEVASAEGLSFVVHWADADGSARGQLYLRGLLPQPRLDCHACATTVPTYATSTTRVNRGHINPVDGLGGPDMPVGIGPALRVTTKARHVITHNFVSAPLCYVPLRVTVQNCHGGISLAFTLHTIAKKDTYEPPSHSETLPATQRLLSSSCYCIGCTRHGERWLPPATKTSITLCMNITAPGMYTLEEPCLHVCAWKAVCSTQWQRAHERIPYPTPAVQTVQVIAA